MNKGKTNKIWKILKNLNFNLNKVNFFRFKILDLTGDKMIYLTDEWDRVMSGTETTKKKPKNAT